MDTNKKKKLAASISITSNIFLTTLKLIVGIISGSLSIISEAIHSLSDFIASIITYFSVVKSSEPADDDHPYGHGKYEDMAGFIEGLLIISAAIFIIFKATKKIVLGIPLETENSLGIIVMSVAVVMNFLVSSYIFKVAKTSDSISLYADGQHLRTDVYSSLGVLIGLLLIKLTGNYALDPIIAILVAAFIFRTGHTITNKSWMNLLDHSLPEEDIKQIEQIINKYSGITKLKTHGIKARRLGPTKDINLTLQFKKDTTICECHKICDEIEQSIRKIYPNCSISIHAEPMLTIENEKI
jgi:cation diffusion facilitator family transporter